MFRKEYKRAEDFSRSEFMRADLAFSRTAYGRKLYIWSTLPIIITIITIICVFSSEFVNGYIDLSNIGILLMVGLGLSAVVKMLYYQALARYCNDLEEKK